MSKWILHILTAFFKSRLESTINLFFKTLDDMVLEYILHEKFDSPNPCGLVKVWAGWDADWRANSHLMVPQTRVDTASSRGAPELPLSSGKGQAGRPYYKGGVPVSSNSYGDRRLLSA